MNPEIPESQGNQDEKIHVLIRTLNSNLHLLEQVTGGEIDTFLDQNGHVYNLRGVQQQIRLSDAIRHTATLDALPANIALLDSKGKIISVNESWRQFARVNDLTSSGYGLGLNYLEICDRTNGVGSFESGRAARGIREVLDGTTDRFSIVYPCHSPTQHRWFMLIVTPVGKGYPAGAVVMHLNVTAERKSRQSLRASETRFRQMAENIRDVFFLRDADGNRMLYVSPAYAQIWGRSCASLYANPESWLESIHPDDRLFTLEKSRQGLLTGEFNIEYRIIRPDGSVRWIESRGFPVRDTNAKIVRIAGVAKDISDTRAAAEQIRQFTNINTALSQCNKAIVHCTSEEELFLKICHIAVQYGGMKMAWVGMIDPATQMLTPVASYGDDIGYLKSVNISVASDDPAGSGQTGIAIREDRPYWCQDCMNDSLTLIWRDYAVRAGIFASAALPLHRNGKVVGAFTLYSGEVEYFKEPVRDLLVDLASEISFALDNLDHETRRKLESKLLLESRERLGLATKSANIGIWEYDVVANKLVWDAQMYSLYGISKEDFSGAYDAWQKGLHPDDRKAGDAAIADAIAGVRDFNIEFRVVWPNGEIHHVEAHALVYGSGKGTATHMIGVNWDITRRKQAEQAMRESEQQLLGAFEYAPIGMALVAPDGRWIKVNKALCALVGYTEAEMLTLTFQEMTHPQDLDTDMEYLRRLSAGEIDHYQMEKRYLHHKGHLVTVLLDVSLIRNLQGLPQYFISQIQDISGRKQAEIRIKYLNRVYAMLSGINTLIVRVYDREELYREACRIAVETGGFSMALIGEVDKLTQMVVPVASAGKDEELLAAVKQLVSSREIHSTTMVARAVREKIAIVSNDSQNDSQVLLGDKYAEAGVRSMVILPLLVEEEAIGVLALYSSEPEFFHKEELELLRELAGDIAFAIYHIDNQDRLKYLAYYDVLTGLANRNLFLERVAQHIHTALGGGHKLALCLMDLERFRNINNSLGRTTGDVLLKQVAEWLIQSSGGDPAGLARIDADHFALVIPVLNPSGNLSHLFEKTMKALVDHPFRVNDTVLRVSAKVGVAIFPDDGANADILYRNAEAALKNAKLSGARYLFYRQKMTEAVAGNLTLENQLRRALDKGEFVLHYQPKVNLVTGKLAGAEALIRWNDPQTGLVPPGRFIPILEQTGLIYEVGRWALYKAVNDYLHWRNTGKPAVRIAVNVSSLQLRNPGFIAEIRQAIDVDPEAKNGLELEITESLIMEDISHTISSLKALREMGICMAIDDFGTGFSSLNYLSRLPVDILKIDRSFVIDMTKSPEGLALVSTIINLAHSLKLKVVAEGVETEEQSRLLRLLNCDEIQGFFISKPLPLDVFESRFLAVVSA